MSFYGSENWYDLKGCSKEFKALGVSYHKAIKKVNGFNIWESNHLVCERVGLPIFRHLLNRRRISFLFSLIETESPCILPLKDYFKNSSCILKHTQYSFEKEYCVQNILANELDALIARINFVQAREPRSNYVPESFS